MTAAIKATISVGEAAGSAWDAVIVGAGPAGSVAAIILSRLGKRVLLIDRAAFPRDKVCGCCLAPAAVEALEELGLACLLDDHDAGPMEVFELLAGRRRIAVPIRGGRVISRRKLDAALVREAISCGAQFLPQCLASIGSPRDRDREVRLMMDGHTGNARARLIIAAGGLGFAVGSAQSLNRREHLWRRSRLGGAAIISDEGVELPRGTVRMIVARRGYVGLARLEDHSLAVGGAFDARLVRASGGLAGAATQVLDEAGCDVPAQVAAARWLGSPQLTRRPVCVAAERVLAVGDAAGFVEPFTGEGMTWAIQSAQRAAAIGHAFLERRDARWSSAIQQQWTRSHRALVRSRQMRCRIIAQALRHPLLLAGCMAAGQAIPRLSEWVVNRIHGENSAPRALGARQFEAARGGA